jgi:hypothetical protein
MFRATVAVDRGLDRADPHALPDSAVKLIEDARRL